MGRDPNSGIAEDLRLLKFIRRANLDALWASEPSTVGKTLSECRRGLRIARSFGFSKTLFRPTGPFPLEDSFGMGAAVVMLDVSLNKGKNDGTHITSVTLRIGCAFPIHF